MFPPSRFVGLCRHIGRVVPFGVVIQSGRGWFGRDNTPQIFFVCIKRSPTLPLLLLLLLLLQLGRASLVFEDCVCVQLAGVGMFKQPVSQKPEETGNTSG